MAKKSRPRSYFEPWSATKDKTWEIAFRFGPPKVDDPVLVEKWHADRGRAEENAPWLVWGSDLWTPSICTSLGGKKTVSTSDGIILTVETIKSDRKDIPSNEAVARRIAECVTACAGIPDPVDLINRVRQLLLEMTRGEADAHDDRVIACLGRMVPLDELQWTTSED